MRPQQIWARIEPNKRRVVITRKTDPSMRRETWTSHRGEHRNVTAASLKRLERVLWARRMSYSTAYKHDDPDHAKIFCNY